ncbi:MAG: DUF5054 domain-containing protein [Eubacterium sp.]|nr:DUF5054 domain-containing protein [Eubacterium sp.]
MKKVFVVSKTHLDLGFTDYAEHIRQKYLNSFIPDAISLAEKVNTPDKKYFVWTTGSWLLKEMLDNADNLQKEKLVNAIKNGNITPHAMPFTTHSELLDYDTFDYGLSIVDELDKIRGRKTVAAKMTDVPGHTKGIVKLLAKHGIKLLHIGVNGVSAMPEVPACFLWKNDDYEIAVIYSGDYGGAFKCDFMDEVLYFDHTLDNHGAPSPQKVMDKFNKIQSQFPDYEITAGAMDDFADIIWEYKDKLPVFEGEIGDTWIHGAATDPYKSASLRELMRLKRQWLNDGSMEKSSKEYNAFSDALLCIAEHTCGMDTKTYFADYESYLKPDFQKARKRDKIIIRHPFRDFPYNILNIINKIRFKSSYSIIEKSWAEQRAYIEKAVHALSDTHKVQAMSALKRLIPASIADVSEYQPYSKPLTFSDFGFELNEYGGIGAFTYQGSEIIRNNNKALLEYRVYTSKDYDYWFNHYSRNIDENRVWGYPDFGRPLLKYADGKYPQGSFYYKMKSAYVCEEEAQIKVFVNLNCSSEICENAGAPREAQIVYTLNNDGLKFDVLWCGKDANRLTEAIFLHLYPNADDFKLVKIGSQIDYNSTVSMGGKNLHAVEKCIMKNAFGNFDFINYHSPLVSIGRGKILEYDNQIENIEKDGISYVLYNNVWGTNFPLWYEDNARFSFKISKNKE